MLTQQALDPLSCREGASISVLPGLRTTSAVGSLAVYRQPGKKKRKKENNTPVSAHLITRPWNGHSSQLGYGVQTTNKKRPCIFNDAESEVQVLPPLDLMRVQSALSRALGEQNPACARHADNRLLTAPRPPRDSAAEDARRRDALITRQ